MRRTAITCPDHSECVCVFHTVPEAELGDRKQIKLPQQYYAWLMVLNEVAVAVEHSPAVESPNKLLSASVVDHARLTHERLEKLEAFATSKRRWRKRFDRG